MSEKEQTYKGYVNYNKIGPDVDVLKTYYFTGKTAEQVSKIEEQFSNPDAYIYHGSCCVKEPQTF